VGLILNPQGKIRSYFKAQVKSTEAVEVEFEDTFLEVLDQFTFGEQYQIEKLLLNQNDSISERERILSLTPKFGSEFKSNEEINPLEVNLRSAIHDQKGCYPGQEVIEKIISLGSPARKLCLFEGTLTHPKLPAPLLDAKNNAVGTLTSYEAGFGLGIVKRNALKENETLFVGTEKLTLRKISE
jgi:folate-binding protein YgfZ